MPRLTSYDSRCAHGVRTAQTVGLWCLREDFAENLLRAGRPSGTPTPQPMFLKLPSSETSNKGKAIEGIHLTSIISIFALRAIFNVSSRPTIELEMPPSRSSVTAAPSSPHALLG